MIISADATRTTTRHTHRATQPPPPSPPPLLPQQQQQQHRHQQHQQLQQQQQQQPQQHNAIQRHTRRQYRHRYHRTTNTAATTTNRYIGLIVCQMVLLLLLSECAQPVHADWLMDCGDCHCKWNSGKKTADCKNLSLAAVPENLSSEVQVLDLSYNRIVYLEQNAFLNAQLHNLHKLFIRNSSLQQIDARSFTQLEILIELDLSNNLLRTLQTNLFARLVKVRALILNGNLLESLSDGIFQNLKYLHKVELKYNRLKRIGTAMFVNVPLLTQIYLDGNRLSLLRKETFESLKRLTALSLDQNPWNCTCELQIFRDFVIKRNLYTPPTACFFPAHLRGMLWVEDLPEAFACKPKIIYPAPGASINTSKDNVTLVCRVHASPNTHIAWDYNKQMYRANALGGGGGGSGSGGVAQQQRVHIQLLRDEQSKEKEFGRDVFVSRLTILGAEKSDEGIYTCLAENAGGKDAVQMSLLVQKPGPRDLLLQGNLLIVICLMAVGLLSVSMFLAMVTCCIYKRFKAINPGHHHHHHHHHLGDVADQLSGAGLEHHQATTTVAGGIDVVLGVSVDDAAVGNLKHHLHHQKNMNGGLASKEKKYAVLDNGIVMTGGGGGGGGVGGKGVGSAGDADADKAYLEQRKEDTLHIKYPHGLVRVDVGKDDGKHHKEANGLLGESGGNATEYQPDLLPAYSSNNKQQQQQEPLYTPVKATKTINPSEDQQLQLVNASHAPKSKYNSNALGYLQSKYGSASKTHHDKSAGNNNKREAPGVPLTTSASLSAAAGGAYSSVTVGPTLESGFSTLQRHSKSLAMPYRGAGTPTTPTDSTYEYRQPPPPPYNAAHRTAASVLMQRRTSACDGKEDGSVNRDPGYRDDKLYDNCIEAGGLGMGMGVGMGVGVGVGVGVGGGNGSGSGSGTIIATRETIVTASPSLNYLTTTEYTPRRQLL